MIDSDRSGSVCLGAIQPHGVLLVLDPRTERIRAAAGDISGLIGYRTEAVGSPLFFLIEQSLTDLTRTSGLRPGAEPLFLGSFRHALGARELDILAHQRRGLVLMELEPSLEDRPSAARLLARLRATVARIKQQRTIADACRAAAAEVRAFTSYDRAVVYQFLQNHSGKAVAEDGNGLLPPLVNQHFRAADLSPKAGASYRQSVVRVIPNVASPPEPILAEAADLPLDLSDCSLRSPSPRHIRYLESVGAAASLSVPVLWNGELWGLIACHSSRPTLVPYEIREACKQISAALTHQMESLAAKAEADEAKRLAKEREQLLANLAASDAIEAEISRRVADIHRLIPADGIVVCYDGKVTTAGVTPDEETCRALAEWSRRKDGTPPYSTAALMQDYRPAADFAGHASGLLAISANQEDPLEILWLRAEHPETIEWAERPYEDAEADEGEEAPAAPEPMRIRRETVRGRARPWTVAEIDAARRLREGIERIKERQRLSHLQSSLIHMSRVNAMGAMASSIAHELNQPLTAVASYTRTAAKLLKMRELGEDMRPMLERAADQSLRAGEIIRHMRQLVAPVEAAIGPCSLASIVEGACSIGLIDATRLGVKVTVSFDPAIQVLADEIQAQQVLLNLIRNSLEALASVEERRLAVTAEQMSDRFVKISVADTGPGINSEIKERLFSAFNSNKEGGLGIGLSICRTIVEAHGGKIWVEDKDDYGACFSFLLQTTASPSDSLAVPDYANAAKHP